MAYSMDQEVNREPYLTSFDINNEIKGESAAINGQRIIENHLNYRISLVLILARRPRRHYHREMNKI
ncbi:hypothetical protein MTR_0568s0020 [Medicago truncatula]|uniref:Uncharacterized protein n=1 Tax=Medicago truncatula TaxID=3880 RepID=A0A072TQC6_MEDTR|nr:hypothetical protein MTR_0568s0020 [Medicago truncatula]